MPIFSTYTTNIPDGTTLKITSGKIGLNADSKTIQYVTADSNVQAVFGIVPIGSIVAWAKNLPSVPDLPASFVECNGQVLSDADSPLNGQTIPDLNASAGTERFLRGSTTSGATGGAETHSHTTAVDNPRNEGAGAAVANSEFGDAVTTESSLPSYYEVVWVMRVK